MEWYRSGHNEADSKSVGRRIAGTWVRIPLTPPHVYYILIYIRHRRNKVETEKIKQMIKMCIAISVLVIIFIIVGTIMIKYEVEGDKNMPFNLSKIMIVSTAEGVESEGKNKWNFNVYQNNDLYFYIDKNNEYKGNDTYIEKVRIENIQIIEAPKIGEIKSYMPNSTEGRLYSYDDTYIIEEALEYRGAGKSNSQTLEIGSQGGSALIRFSNTNLGVYSSDDDTEIIHDGTLLNKLNLTQEDIDFTVSFDLVIEVQNHAYRANIELELPYGNMLENGTESTEKVDMNDVIFKRE